jgi:hypothetical protein
VEQLRPAASAPSDVEAIQETLTRYVQAFPSPERLKEVFPGFERSDEGRLVMTAQGFDELRFELVVPIRVRPRGESASTTVTLIEVSRKKGERVPLRRMVRHSFEFEKENGRWIITSRERLAER